MIAVTGVLIALGSFTLGMIVGAALTGDIRRRER